MASSSSTKTPQELITTFEYVRKVCLSSPATEYPRYLPAILHQFAAPAPREVQIWGLNFLAETFALPTLPRDLAPSLGKPALRLLRVFLDSISDDTPILKSTIQTATLLYPIFFRYAYVIYFLSFLKGRLQELGLQYT